MNIEIKNRWDGSIIYAGEYADLKAAVEDAVKRGSDLSGSDLSGSNLSGSNLSGSNGLNSYLCTPLLMLLDQPGKIRAYKLVTKNGEGPYNGGIIYEIGGTYKEPSACADVNIRCAEGISLATLDWCMKEWKPGYHILVAEFAVKDIAAIPTATDGKFRVSKCKIIGEKDLVEIGLVKPEEDSGE
jgi:hypothetical protein